MHKKGNWFDNISYYNFKSKVFRIFINFLKKKQKKTVSPWVFFENFGCKKNQWVL